MSQPFFTSDLHDGHKAIGQYRNHLTNGFVTDVRSNREFIRLNWRARKNDCVYMVGDICFAKESVDFIRSLPGRKILITGNHCLENRKRPSLKELSTAFDRIVSSLSWSYQNNRFTMTHIPIHPLSLRGKKNIHGHIHDVQDDIADSNYINVNMDCLYPRHGNIMITADELIKYYCK